MKNPIDKDTPAQNLPELIDQIRGYNPKSNLKLIRDAFEFARRAHQHQKRKSGEPFFLHPLAVTSILARYQVDDATLVAALLHDTVEDTDASLEIIEEKFGLEISIIVDGLTKLKELDFITEETIQGERFRKLLMAVAKDIRVLLVKIVDRLHNMRTLGSMPKHKQVKISQETLDIYIPLAGRLGMQHIREELEDIAFRRINPDAYAMVDNKLKRFTKKVTHIVEDIKAFLEEELEKHHITAQIYARQKSPFSIWRKMERKALSFDMMSDILAMRIIVNDPDECYIALGIIHQKWHCLQERFKDYISDPKPNDYKSIHTTIVMKNQQRVEIQIRDWKMHEIAENGIAAHALYKDEPTVDGEKENLFERLDRESRAYRSLKAILSQRVEGDRADELLENTRLELFSDQVFCLTPKGMVISLPSGSGPLDFAFAVHTEVGLRYVGAQVNGRSASINTRLKNGDQVRILTSSAASPAQEWHSVVKTARARDAIRRNIRMRDLNENAKSGLRILQYQLETIHKKYDEVEFKAVLGKLDYNTKKEALAAIGRGELEASTVVTALHPKSIEDIQHPSWMRIQSEGLGKEWFTLSQNKNFKFFLPSIEQEQNNPQDIQPNLAKLSVGRIRELIGDNASIKLKEHSGIVPGDRIVGIIHENEGIVIYSIDSPDLLEFEDQTQNWLDVRWDIDPESPERFQAIIRANVVNQPGTLAKIADILGKHDANIDNITFEARQAETSIMLMELEVWDIQHVTTLLNHMVALPVVHEIERVMR